MAVGSWSGKLLPYAMVRQRLESLGCREVEALSAVSRRWRTPTGFAFVISTDDIDAETLEAIVEKIISSAGFAPE